MDQATAAITQLFMRLFAVPSAGGSTAVAAGQPERVILRG
jgi:hypothetical protein